MTKKHFIELADTIRSFNYSDDETETVKRIVLQLADFCQKQNPQFNRQRWLAYIAGACGPNGGTRKGAVR